MHRRTIGIGTIASTLLISSCTMVGNGTEQQAAVVIESPEENARVYSPFTIEGRARGTWYFEGVLPISIEAEDGTGLRETTAQAEGEWMTEDYVPFSISIAVTVENETQADIVVHKSNPSGLPENDAEIRVPITIVPGEDTTVPIEQRFSGTIVYGTSLSATEEEAARQHCEEQNGTYNTCGSPCAPNADACIEVCAHTCDLPEGTQTQTGAWNTYESEQFGFSIEHPEGMTIETTTAPPSGSGVRLMFLGQTQTANTELFDGISTTILRGEYDTTLEEHVEAQIETTREVGTIIQPMERTTVDGIETITYTAETLGEHTHYYVPLADNGFFHISTSSPDPEDQGYDENVQRMIESFGRL